MNSQLIITTCGAFVAILAFAFTFYTKHDTINRKIKVLFIVLLSIVLAVFAYALNSAEVVNSAPKNVNLMSDKLSPQEAGTTIKWTATASDPDNDRVQYKFLLDGQPRTDWSYDSNWNWTTSSVDIGFHKLECKVKDGSHNVDGDDFKDIDFTIFASNQPPSIISLSPSPNSPQPAGTTIAWAAKAIDPDNDQIFYKYILNGKSETGWSSDNTWTWSTTNSDVGENQIEVRIRDGKHAGPDSFDRNVVDRYTITEPKPKPIVPENKPPVMVSLVSDKSSPQDVGTITTWTATASDPENDPLVYRFLLKGKTVSD